MTSVLLPEGELRVARCDMLDKLIAVGDGDAALLYLYILRHGGTNGSRCSARPTSERRPLRTCGIHAQQPDRADGKNQSSNRQIHRSTALHRR